MGRLLDCRDATRLISRELDGPLPRGWRLMLRLHLFWCGPCRRFLQQTRLLRAAMRQYRS